LLRGINVGGRNKIPMTELRASLSALGLERVATYIQSGNVVFQSPAGAAQEIAAGIERQIVDVFGIGLAVMLRTPAELGAIADANPFLEGEANLSRLHVAFLDRAPTASAVTQLDPHRSPPDAFSVVGCEIYLHFPNGSGRSKLTIDYFERRLGVRATARNWKTLVRLRAMTQELADGPSA
jgi:uncharacterized protein (DUF1697 family)